MAINIYNPQTKVFQAFNAPDNSPLSTTDMLLLNILIEQQAQTEYLAALNETTIRDTSEVIRAGIVSNIIGGI